MAHELLTFRLTKLNGSLNRQVRGYRVPSSLAPYSAIVPFGQQILTRDGSFWVSENAARYHYWPDRWHNILTLYTSDRQLRGLYCDIVTPATFMNGVVAAIDLDLDLWVHSDRSYRVIDEDEFVAHAASYGYAPNLVDGARSGLASLLADLETGCGLFATSELFDVSNDEWALMTAETIPQD